MIFGVAYCGTKGFPLIFRNLSINSYNQSAKMIRYIPILVLCVLAQMIPSEAQSNRYGYAKKESYSELSSRKVLVFPTKSGDSASIRGTHADTIRTNRIVNTYGQNDVYTINIDLVENNDNLRISLFNLLGKKVLDIYSGEAPLGRFTREFTVSSVPKGMYLCVVRGDSFQLTEKFVLSR